MRNLIAALALGVTSTVLAADATENLRAGVTLMPVKVYSLEDDRKVLKAFEGLRVADVSDGMDFVGLQDIGLVNPEIHPLWKDAVNYSHRIIGIAVTGALRSHPAATGRQAQRGRVRQVGG
jgi:hypothetical protein